MRKSSIDRRTAHTRQRLERAHLALIRTKGYEALTIKDICAVANVGRSTFYAHYASKDDLKRKSMDHLRRLLIARQSGVRGSPATPGGAPAQRFAFSLPMFEHAREHLDLYRALAGTRGGEIALTAIREILCDLVRGELAKTTAGRRSNATPREMAVRYVVGAYMAVLTWWLDGGAILPPEELDVEFRRLATGALAGRP